MFAVSLRLQSLLLAGVLLCVHSLSGLLGQSMLFRSACCHDTYLSKLDTAGCRRASIQEMMQTIYIIHCCRKSIPAEALHQGDGPGWMLVELFYSRSHA